MINNYSRSRKSLTWGMIILFMLTIMSLLAPAEAQAFSTTTILSGSRDYTINDEFVICQLRPDYTGTITIGRDIYSTTIIGSYSVNKAKIVILNRANGHTLKLNIKDLQLNSSGHGIDLQLYTNTTLNIDGKCEITASGTAIHAPTGKILVMEANRGSEIFLNSGDYCAGIGGANGESGGNITMMSGAVTTTGGIRGAGIGGGQSGAGGNFYLRGGIVNAKGGLFAAGVGGGWSGAGGSADIYDGTLNATGAESAAGIGGGCDGNGSTVNISGGTVTAKAGGYANGIGNGQSSLSATNPGTVKISGGTVTAQGGVLGAGIGGNGSNVNISGGIVNATGGRTAAGIGSIQYRNGGTVAISGGTVTATGGSSGAGIGGGWGGSGAAVTISGTPIIIATAGSRAEHIGSGSSNWNSGTLTDTAGNSLSYLRFQVKNSSGAGLGGANVNVNSTNYITNDQGLTGCTASGSAASYTASAAGYTNKTETVTLGTQNIEVPVTLTPPAVTYDGNGATSGTVPAAGSGAPGSTTVIVADNAGSLVKEGYTFNGWNTAADGGGTAYAYGDKLEIGTADVMLYAQWITVVKTLTVTVNTSSTNPSAGSAFDVTVTAKDASGNTVTGYTGTVHFTSSDTQAVLPSDYTFVASDNGTHTFTGGVTLNTVGTQTVTATDTTTQNITGTTNSFTVTSSTTSNTHTISVSPNSSAGGTVSGGGTYNDSTSVTVKATAYSGCQFVNWTEDGTVVSINATYSFNLTADRTLVANFSETTADCLVTYQGAQKRLNSDGTYDVRFLATIDTLSADSVGFVFSKSEPNPTILNVPHSQVRSTSKVYNSITAAGSTVTAASLGGTYIIACTVTGIPAADINTPLYVRAFSTVGTETTYSSVHTVKVSSLH